MRKNTLTVTSIALVALLAAGAAAGTGYFSASGVTEPQKPVPATADEVPRISSAELRQLMEKDDVVVIDVRGQQSYETGHIPGAILVPSDELAAVLVDLKAGGKTVVTYCA